MKRTWRTTIFFLAMFGMGYFYTSFLLDQANDRHYVQKVLERCTEIYSDDISVGVNVVYQDVDGFVYCVVERSH